MSKQNLTNDTLTLWCDTIISKVDTRISYSIVKREFQHFNIPTFKQVLDFLNNMYETFFVVHNYKTSNIVAVIC